MSLSDPTLLILLGTCVGVTALTTEHAARRGWLPQWIARKILHVIAVGCCAIAPLYLADRQLLIGIVAVAEIALLVLVTRGVLFVEADGRPAWGIALFPLAYLVLLLAPVPVEVVYLSMLVLALSDPLAALVGKTFGRYAYNWTGDAKTWLGSSAFAAATLVLLWLHRSLIFPADGGGAVGYYLAATALLLTLAEGLGSKGWDNVFIPLGAALLILLLPDGVYPADSRANLVLTGCTLLFVGAALFGGWLTTAGALTAGALGWSVIWVAGAWAIVPPLLFFGGSLLIGKLLGPPRGESDPKQGRARDATQVLANGGVYWLLVLLPVLTRWEISPTLLLASIAISTADTWASEIGTRYGGATYDSWRRRRLPVGVSGGVSLVGTLGGLAGSALIALAAGYLPVRVAYGTVLLVGFGGMLVDSLLGATLQIRYRNADGRLSDRESENATVETGFRWVTNDVVNVLTNVLVTGLTWLLLSR